MQRHNVQSRVIPTYFLDATFLYRIEVVFAYGLHRTFVVISDELGHSTVVIFVRMYIMLLDPFTRDLTKKHRKSKGTRYRHVLVLVFLCACLSFACCEIRERVIWRFGVDLRTHHFHCPVRLLRESCHVSGRVHCENAVICSSIYSRSRS